MRTGLVGALIITVFGLVSWYQAKLKGFTTTANTFAVLTFLGMLCFSVSFWLPRFGPALDHFELPNSLGATTITGSEAGVFVVSTPIQRVQRYQENGSFLNGWFVPAAGGHFSVKLADDGKLEVCTARGRRLMVYDEHGQVTARQDKCEYQVMPSTGVFLVRQGWVSYIFFPLWHPIVGWLMFAAGVAFFAFGGKSDPSE
jgi:hypothetical protein